MQTTAETFMATSKSGLQLAVPSSACAAPHSFVKPARCQASGERA
jgi:hypothetical protein